MSRVLPDYSEAALAIEAGADPWALARTVTAGSPDDVRAAGQAFRAAAVQAAEVARLGAIADSTTASAYFSNRAEVYDVENSEREGRTLLSGNGELMEEVARLVLEIGDGLDLAAASADSQLRELTDEINDVINRRNAFMAGPGRMMAAEDAESADWGYHQQAVAAVRHRAAKIQDEVDLYDQLLSSRIGYLDERGYAAQTPRAPDEGSWISDVGDFVADVGTGLWNSVTGTLDLASSFSLSRAVSDPMGYSDELIRYAGAPAQLIEAFGRDPLGTLDQVVAGGNIGKGQPGVAVGEILGGVVVGGIAAKALRTLRFADGVTLPARAIIDDGKFDYLFGRSSSGQHNSARSLQNVDQLARIGIHDSVDGRTLLQEHFDAVVETDSNVARTFSNDFGTFEVRESLLAGPGGFLHLESTWQVTDQGLRLTTVIPRGGQ